MGENVKVSREMNVPEINAMVKAILEDSEVAEAINRLGVPLSEVYKDVSNEVAGLAKRAENEEKVAKNFIKVQVLKYLMAKEADKVAEENDENVKKEIEEITASEEQQQAYASGNINAMLVMIQREGIVIGSDGKTARKLTAQEKKELIALLKEGYMPLSAILKQIEFEEKEQNEEVKSEIEGETIEETPGNMEEQDFENVGRLEEERNEKEEKGLEEDFEEEYNNGEEDFEEYNNGEEELPEEEQMQDENPSSSLEDYHYRLANNNEKRLALENNPEYGVEYEHIDCYIPPVGTTIEAVAEFIMKFQEENPNQKLTVVFNGYLVDPQKYSSPTEIIDSYKEKTEEHRENNINELQDNLEGLSTGLVNDPKRNGKISETAKDIIQLGDKDKVITIPEEQQDQEVEQAQQVQQGQKIETQDNDEHPYPEL